jgi:effector-binding domain-containing protein
LKEKQRMEIVDIKPINFLCHRATTTLKELAKFTAVTQELFAEAVELGLPITGAVHWHYFGLTDMAAPFTLEVSLPVGKIAEEYDGKFHFKRTESYKAVISTHRGPWEKLPDSYNKMYTFIHQQHVIPDGSFREIYVNADFTDPDANVTEIQIGIA